MPDLAQFHPQVVHFTVALLLVGVGFRIFSLTGLLRFTNPAATTLLLIGTAATLLAVESGVDAHGPVERIPGARALVVHHEERAEQTRNIFLVVAALELVALGLAYKETLKRYSRVVHVGSALAGVFGGMILYETAEHGGEIVYRFAGGPGIRSGDPRDVERLLLAGLYHQSREDRKAGRPGDAAALTQEMAKRFPSDTTVRFLRVESLLLDVKDYPAALAAVDSVAIAPTDARWRARQATLKADIYIAMGQVDSARAVLEPVVAAFPQNARLKAKLDSVKVGAR
jgi:uncharacterized membrane protein